MRRIHVEASTIIDARPEEVYALLIDYRNGHPQILPSEHFRDLQVEAGGRGMGTIIRFRVCIGTLERSYRMLVSEPEPGRVFIEADIESDLMTTFTITALSNGHKTHVQIATQWESANKGLSGLLEQALSPIMMRHIYHKELRLLAAVMHSKHNSHIKSL